MHCLLGICVCWRCLNSNALHHVKVHVSFAAGTAQRRIELQLCGHRDSPTAGVVERAMPLSSSQISKEMLRGKQLVSLCTFGHYLATAAAFAIAHHTNQHSVEVHQGSAS